jgi:DNA-directed RNA polymerase sigma subunit (sigma70/sigma32)
MRTSVGLVANLDPKILRRLLERVPETDARIETPAPTEARETTTRVLVLLTPREERVLRMRFGIGMNTDHTVEEVGREFSLPPERVRWIEVKALRKLKHPSRSRKRSRS